MPASERPHRFGEHDNAFGFLRLLFALLVIVSHVPEVVDNDAHREVLHRLTGVVTSGGIAVDGFFVISGYLITGSFLTSRSTRSYLAKRIARIYPAFALASLLCLVIVAPLSGAGFPLRGPRSILVALTRIAILARPQVAGAFPGQHYNDAGAALDGAMWTIQYEFACYLLVIALAAALEGLALAMPEGRHLWLQHADLFPGAPPALPGLVGMFVAGAAFHSLRQRLSYRPVHVLVATVCLAAGLLHPLLAAPAYAVFGAYLIFYVADRGAGTLLARINNQNDISYGVYLYGWPVEQMLIRYLKTGDLVLLCILTASAAAVLGWLSWSAVERPAMRYLRRRGSSSAPAEPTHADAAGVLSRRPVG